MRLFWLRLFVAFGSMSLGLGLSIPAGADIPRTMSYDGVLYDANGQVTGNSRRDLTFSLYVTPTGGTPIWTEVQPGVRVNGGAFHVVLGKGNPARALDLAFDQVYYLGIRVDGGAEMTPRQELLATPYSFRARSAETVDDGAITTGKLAPGAVTDDKIESLSWSKVTGGPSGVPANVWSLQGNRGTDPNVDFLGTTDDAPLTIGTMGLPRLIIQPDGRTDVKGDLYTDGLIKILNGTLLLKDEFAGLRREVGKTTWFAPPSENLLLMGGNVGVGGDDPRSKLSVFGNLAVGETYAGESAPEGGAIIEGPLGLGTPSPGAGLLLDVNGHTKLTGTLDALGLARFKNSDQSTDPYTGAVTIAGGLGVGRKLNTKEGIKSEGVGEFHGLNVDAPSFFKDITVDGGVDVTLPGTSTRTSILNVKDGATQRFRIDKNGRMYLNSDATGPFNNLDSYAMDVRGQTQGISIGLKSVPDLDSDTHFMTFRTFVGNTSTRRGRIEGQNVAEFFSDPHWIIDTGVLVAEGVAAGIAAAALSDFADLVIFGLNVAAEAEHIILYTIDELGVTYESGAGDYAEWLPRSASEPDMLAGTVVGVFGGQIRRATRGAERVLVISTNPIVLGNMPPEGKEADFEKVAFLGQVPVRVNGPVAEGDYVVPSGLDDGTAVAVEPAAMAAEDYRRAIGRAWESSTRPGTRLIKVAVGLNSGDVADVVAQQETRLQSISARLASLEATMAQMARANGSGVVATQPALFTGAPAGGRP